jgi:hypothetical protein
MGHGSPVARSVSTRNAAPAVLRRRSRRNLMQVQEATNITDSNITRSLPDLTETSAIFLLQTHQPRPHGDSAADLGICWAVLSNTHLHFLYCCSLLSSWPGSPLYLLRLIPVAVGWVDYLSASWQWKDLLESCCLELYGPVTSGRPPLQ